MFTEDPVLGLLIFVWLVAAGGCIGSFINVVVYRLPLGMSLSVPSSHCPRCKHPIRFYDNVPVFGWLRLRGKCRDCKASISFRYPLIEGCSAALFGFNAAVLSMDMSLRGGLFIFLALTFSVLSVTLLTAGLIEYDGHKVPLRLFLPAAVCVVLCVVLFCCLEAAAAVFGISFIAFVVSALITRRMFRFFKKNNQSLWFLWLVLWMFWTAFVFVHCRFCFDI
ncbi:hypothetical protein FACS189419_01760 [Planctomycetales bacterium]|nr:hypothetical protein FACS189419_01760 [Planctomycetales bacterium]